MFDLLALMSGVSCSVWGQRSPGGQVRFEVSVMLFGGQPEAPANSQKGKLRPASTGKGGLPCAGEARASGAGAGSWGQARVQVAPSSCVGGRGGGAARGHGHQHLGMSWGEEAGLEAIRGADTGPGARAGRPARKGSPADPARWWPQRAPQCWELLGIGTRQGVSQQAQ